MTSGAVGADGEAPGDVAVAIVSVPAVSAAFSE
jgi:hypothetical protein